MKVITVEGTIVDVSDYVYAPKISIPLKAVKEYRYCDTLKRSIPVQFIETFEEKSWYFIEDKESEPIVWTRYVSMGVS